MVVDKSISRRKPYCTIKRNPFDDPQFQRRLHLHRRIFDSSPARDLITSGITIWKTFHPPPVSQNRAMEAVEKCERGKLANRRERVVEHRFAWAPLPPRDVVKYVAIYTGDWRHWRLGSKRARARSLLSPFLALFPGLPNSRPSVLIMSSSNPCAGRGGLPDQKSIWGIPVSAWAMQNRNRVRFLPALLFILQIYLSFFFLFFLHLFYRWYPISWFVHRFPIPIHLWLYIFL